VTHPGKDEEVWERDSQNSHTWKDVIEKVYSCKSYFWHKCGWCSTKTSTRNVYMDDILRKRYTLPKGLSSDFLTQFHKVGYTHMLIGKIKVETWKR